MCWCVELWCCVNTSDAENLRQKRKRSKPNDPVGHPLVAVCCTRKQTSFQKCSRTDKFLTLLLLLNAAAQSSRPPFSGPLSFDPCALAASGQCSARRSRSAPSRRRSSSICTTSHPSGPVSSGVCVTAAGRGEPCAPPPNTEINTRLVSFLPPVCAVFRVHMNTPDERSNEVKHL